MTKKQLLNIGITVAELSLTYYISFKLGNLAGQRAFKRHFGA